MYACLWLWYAFPIYGLSRGEDTYVQLHNNKKFLREYIVNTFSQLRFGCMWSWIKNRELPWVFIQHRSGLQIKEQEHGWNLAKQQSLPLQIHVLQALYKLQYGLSDKDFIRDVVLMIFFIAQATFFTNVQNLKNDCDPEQAPQAPSRGITGILVLLS